MTSRNLFFKLVKQDIKKRIWCPILIFIVYFLIFEVVLLMQLEEIAQNSRHYEYTAAEYVATIFMGSNDVLYTLCICMTALICAVSGFSYMNSKIQIDTYHSMPVKRGMLFFSKYVSGILQFLIPFIIHIGICLVIAASQDAFTMLAIKNALVFVGVEFLFFALAYGSILVAMCLTGNTIISVIAAAVVFSYSLILEMVIELLFNEFFITYIAYDMTSKLKILAFSPLSMLLIYNQKNDRYFNEITADGINYLVIILIAAIIYMVLAYLLYKMRPSEAAGKTIAFEWSKPVIKILIVVPVALYTGMFFNEISSNSDSMKWFLFGAVFGYILISLIMESIFEMDIRGAFRHKRQFVFNAVCLAFIIVAFKFDVLGYDAYVPNQNEMESCAVSINELLDVPLREKNKYGGYNYISADEYRMQNMQIKDNESAMKLAKKLAEQKLDYESYPYYEGVENEKAYQELVEKQSGYCTVIFGYNLNNGKKIYRRYIADTHDEETLQLITEVFNDEEYKLASTPLLNEGWNTQYDFIACNGNFYEEVISINSQMQAELMEAFNSEYLKLDMKTITDIVPIGTISFIENEEFYGFHYNTYAIYPQFTKTIELIGKYGFDFNRRPEADNIYKIEIENIIDIVPVNNQESAQEVEFTDITDRDQIEAIIPYLVNAETANVAWNYTEDLYSENSVRIDTADEKITNPYYYILKDENTPEIIKNIIQ